MPRITTVYTRTGDDGSTALGAGGRVQKDALRIECYGTVDELNSTIGVAVAAGVSSRSADVLARVQNDLFHLGSDLCVPEAEKEKMPVPRIEERHITFVEEAIDGFQADLPPLTNFILPGGGAAAAHLHVSRTVCRRAERLLVALRRNERIGAHAIPYLNRLSDLLFVMARWENRAAGTPDVTWDSRA